ncbi:TetR/AcrR family transcriptional regulator [Tomitella gaofuii]|uniref:TetR/AcrR family transcriptional regulator n=1 Tax=Tomitella gaofuii TaxID=2760083 RepID=UPI001C71109C|nr:TetR/AcrR family transcriptional regulator [Tomitella gaofuii]
MADRSGSTSEKLLTAGERLFARHGIDGTLTRQIVAAAGQGNDSAVNYHFGSRHGLLQAIIARHMADIEDRQPHGPLPRDADGLVDVIVRPVSGELRSPSGRDFLRITAQLAGHSGVATRRMAQPLRHSSVGAQLDALADVLLRELPEPMVRERLAMLIGMLTAVLSDRARRIDEEPAVLLAHEDFVDTAVAMLAAAVRAPLRPGGGAGR